MKFRKDLPEGGGSGNFLKLKDKESVYGVFRGDTYEFFTIWENGKGKPAREGDPGAKFRFRINFIVKEGASYVPKIWEQGQMVYEKLSSIHDELGLESVVVKITRRGEKLETDYDILVTRQPVTPEMEEIFRHIKLLDLKGKNATGQNNPPDEPFPTQFEQPPEFDPDEIPF